MEEAMSKADAGRLQQLSGPEFDREFLDAMILHNQGAVTMAIDALAWSRREEVRTLAQQITSTQKQEVKLMQGWRSEWFGPH
jgi:uncharacterized protein (DUF305 family)